MESRGTVLVVEDNPTEQKLLRMLIDRFGYTPTIVGDGSSAVELLEHGCVFDLILMDWQMIDMDGLECARRIRTMEKLTRNHVPIVAVTARVLLGDRSRCIEAGMDDYLSKPYTTQDLRAMLAKWIDGCVVEEPSAKTG